MPLDKLFKLRMYGEVRSFFLDSMDSLDQITELVKEQYTVTNLNKDELLLKQINPDLSAVEIKIAPRKLVLTMDNCQNYQQFVDILQPTLKLLAPVVSAKEIITIGVEGLYLYPIISMEEFTEIAHSWSDNYLNNQTNQVEISDIGVTVFFREGSLRVNLVCRFLPQNQVKEYFIVDPRSVSDMNLFISIDISTDEPLKNQSAAFQFLSQAIKNHVTEATQLMEERLGKRVKTSED